MHLITLYFENLWQLLNMISIYIVLGLLAAGVLKQILPPTFIQKHIGSHSISSILKAGILGIPLPLCSCSVIPFATSLKNDGASKPALQTFFISAPITGADSITATWGAMGSIFAIYRVITSTIIAFIAGFLTLFFIKKETSLFSTQKPENFSLLLKSSKQKQNVHRSFTCRENILKNIYNYAFTTLLGDIAKPLIIGIFIAALITTFMPDSLPTILQNSPLLNYISILLISIPLYVCATASIPLAISFILAGFSPGAALIFLTAGPGTSMITMPIIKKLLGTKSLIIYLVSIIVGSFLAGYLLDMLFQNPIKNHIIAISSEENITFFHIFSTIALLVFCLKIFKKRYF